MSFRQLIVLAVAAALLGLVAAGLVRLGVSGAPGPEARMPAAPPAAPAEAPASPAEEPGPSAIAAPEATPASPPRRAGKRRRSQAAPSQPARDAFAQALDHGIHQLGERRYEIERATLELALANLGSLAGSVHVAPALREGKPFGFRLHAVKVDGPIAKLGLRDDDVLVSVNGLDLATPDRVLDAYSKLRSARHLELGLLRAGHMLAQEYTIR